LKVKVARTAGFCMGVRRALDLVFDAVRAAPGERGRLSTLGPLIHNHQALEALEALGVRKVEDLSEVEGGTVVIRAHGAGPSLREAIRARDLVVVDATCPRVVGCQRAVERAASAGRQILIAGDVDHAEVEALLDFASGRAVVVPTVERAREVELAPPVTLIAQTTLNAKTYERIGEVLGERLDGAGEGALEVVHSLCRSTEVRQYETADLAREVDAVVVVGGRHSANTRRLAEVARSLGPAVFQVETADDLRAEDFVGISSVGVTAGASTPAWVTERVVARLWGIDSRLRRAVRAAAGALVGSNILLAAAAASVTYAAVRGLGMTPGADVLFMAFAYMFWSYAANRAGEGGRAPEGSVASGSAKAATRRGRARSPGAASERAGFFGRHRGGVLAVAGVLSAAALALAFAISPVMGGVLAGGHLFAALYSLRILPARVRLRDIPGSKDLLIALAWAFVAVVLPRLAEPWTGIAAAELAVAAGGVFLLGFSAATSVALGDVQSDRLIGRESVAVLLGRGRARLLAAAGAGVVAIGASAGAGLGLLPPAAIGFAFGAAVILVATLRRRRPGGELATELAVEGALFASGPVAFAATHLLG